MQFEGMEGFISEESGAEQEESDQGDQEASEAESEAESIPKKRVISKTYQRPKRAKLLSDSESEEEPEVEVEKEDEMKDDKENRPDLSDKVTGIESITKKSIESIQKQEDNLDDRLQSVRISLSLYTF